MAPSRRAGRSPPRPWDRSARRAESAYAAALRLDDSDPDAIFARLSFLVRQRRFAEALRAIPDSVSALLSTHELAVGNVDVTVILEQPKIKDYVGAMRASISQALGIDAGRVSIKGKTNEGVDAVGRGEAIAAHAVAFVYAR